MGKNKYLNQTAETDLDLSFNLNQDLSTGKKKKRKKHNKSFADESDTILNGSFTSNNISAKKKSSQKKKLKEETFINDNEDVSDSHMAEWTHNENQALLKETLKQKIKAKSFRRALLSIDYTLLANNFPDKSPIDCKTQLNILIKNTAKMKTLSQIIEETYTNYDPKKINSKNFIGKYMEQNKDQIEATVESQGGSKLVVAMKMWKELPKEERETYLKRNSRRRGNCFSDTAISPFDAYYEHLKKKNSEVEYLDAKQKYKEISLNKKLKYVKKSVDSLIKEQEEIDVYMGKNSESLRPESSKTKWPTQEEIKYYLKHLEIPCKPASSVYIYYFKESNLECADPLKFLHTATQAFKQLSEKEQKRWRKKHSQALSQYKDEFEQWKNNQNSFILQLFDRVDPTKKSLAKEFDKFKKVEMPLNNVKFSSEPKFPLINPLSLYYKKLEELDGRKTDYNTVKKMFKELNDKDKNVLIDRAQLFRNEFIERVKEFVESMPEEQKKLYLGFRRVKLSLFLKEDIFAEDYPDELYPVYIKAKTEPKKIKQRTIDDMFKIKLEAGKKDNKRKIDERDESSLKKFAKRTSENHESDNSDSDQVNKILEISSRKIKNSLQKTDDSSDSDAQEIPSDESINEVWKK